MQCGVAQRGFLIDEPYREPSVSLAVESSISVVETNPKETPGIEEVAKGQGSPSRCPRVVWILGGMNAFKVGEGRVLSENHTTICRLLPWRAPAATVASPKISR